MSSGESRKRPGSVTPWLLISLLVIVGIVAIGMDGGRMMEERRHAQATADAAALAAANQLYKNYFYSKGSAADAARSAAAANGYANDGVASIITVNIPPKSGAFAGKADHVEVIAQRNLSATFGAVFTGKPLAVRARTVARGRPRKIGIMALNQTAANAFTNTGLGIFTVLGAPIYVNSNNAGAFNQNGLGPVIASSLQISGGYVNSSGGLLLGNIDTGVEPSPDPLVKYPLPNPAGYPVRSNKPLVINSILPTILQPGVYQGGIDISGASIVTMLPGVYIMDGGGFKVSGLSSVIGTEAMIYNTSISQPAGPITFNTTGAVAIVPPLSGTYQGMAIMQDRNLAQPVSMTGYAVTSILGLIYAPKAPLSLSGLAGVGLSTLGSGYIADTITVSGIGSINIDLGPHYVRVPDITIVE